MKKVIIPVFLLVLVACKNSEDESWRKEAAAANERLKEIDAKAEYVKWRVQQEKYLRYKEWGKSRVDTYVDSLAKVDYFHNEIPYWFEQETTDYKRTVDSIIKVVKTQQRE